MHLLLFTRLLITWFTVDSTKAVLIVSPFRQRSPKFGMNSKMQSSSSVLLRNRPDCGYFFKNTLSMTALRSTPKPKNVGFNVK